jgi:hypothetical protein
MFCTVAYPLYALRNCCYIPLFYISPFAFISSYTGRTSSVSLLVMVLSVKPAFLSLIPLMVRHLVYARVHLLLGNN